MGRIKVSYYRIRIPVTKGRPQKPVRIAVIGDLHGRVFGEGNGQLADVILRHYPDLVFSVGDLIVAESGAQTGVDVAVSLMKRLACDCPVYCANGNHEQRAGIHPERYRDAGARLSGELKKAGIALLENQSAQMEINGARLTVHGLNIPQKYYKKFGKECISAEEIRSYIGQPQDGRYNILLAHNPVFFESYALWGADLTLSGHLHGGVVRLPFIGGLLSPQVKLFPRYDRGMYEKYGRKLIVTAGLGTHSMMVRVNNPPEVVILELG